MNIGLFFRKWYSNDKTINFYALLFCGMNVTVEKQAINRLSCRYFVERIGLGKTGEAVFHTRLNSLSEAFYARTIDLNYIVRRLEQILNAPRAPKIPLDALCLLIVRDEILQRRFFEFLLERLNKQAQTNRTRS